LIQLGRVELDSCLRRKDTQDTSWRVELGSGLCGNGATAINYLAANPDKS
jgi:hypothetical protein